MRCHDVTTPGTITSYAAGSSIPVEWVFQAPHPGDCSVWLAYPDATGSVANPEKWIKLQDFPGCLNPQGGNPPNAKINVPLPKELPSCEHCVLRWEWYAVQQVGNVEFYVNCADIKITGGMDNCKIPDSDFTSINGIEHLAKNYNPGGTADKACPFYNAYTNAPEVSTRSRGPLAWVPKCGSGGSTGGGGGAVVTTQTTVATTVVPPTTPGKGISGKAGIVK